MVQNQPSHNQYQIQRKSRREGKQRKKTGFLQYAEPKQRRRDFKVRTAETCCSTQSNWGAVDCFCITTGMVKHSGQYSEWAVLRNSMFVMRRAAAGSAST